MSAETARPCGPEEIDSWANFLDANFGYRPPDSYRVDFAPLFEQTALSRSRLIWKEGQIASSATLYPANLITPQKKLKLAIIGAVATAERWRGHGLSSQILKDLEFSARAAGSQGLVLWSDQTEFYAKVGFSAVGHQDIYNLRDLPEPEHLAGKPSYGWALPDVKRLYERHPIRAERNDEYWQSLERIKSCTRMQWLGEHGDVLAYLAFDRGRDLAGIVHEWGGQQAALHALLWVALQTRPELMWLTHPALDDGIRKVLPSDALLSSGTLALFKSLHAELSPKDLEAAWFWGLDSL